MTIKILNKDNTYKNKHHEKHNKEKKTHDKFPYSLPCKKWLSVEDIYKEFEPLEEKETSE